VKVGQATLEELYEGSKEKESRMYAEKDWKTVPKRMAQPSCLVMITDGGHHDNISSENEKETMAKINKAPWFVPVGSILTTTLLRAGFKLVGPGNYPMYLLTVCGRKSGQMRTIPIVTIERNGNRYLASPFGTVAWVRNLQAAGEATLMRGRRVETVKARELPLKEAARVLQEDIKGGNPFARYYQVTANSSFEEFERAAAKHPVFLLQSVV
jgi:deazaflavin-dependent oxidoreductase (nitroreductase family)